MNFFRSQFKLSAALCVLASILSVAAFSADQTPVKKATPPVSAPSTAPVLPTEFAGWEVRGVVEKSTDPAAADATNGPILKEYGFQRLEKASYTRDDGRNLVIRAAVFDDASGAYGAFTYYQQPDMGVETIGAQAASTTNRVLFYQGNVLVDALFDKVSVMSAAQLRQLAGLLPQAEDSKRNPPNLPLYLPRASAERRPERNTTKYVLGPLALDRVGSPLPVSMVDFASGAEVVLARYQLNAGDATLMLVEYPTPQIAAEKLRQIDASHHMAEQKPGVSTILDVGPFFDARTGPIIVIAAGPLSQSDARTLMSGISYEADVTWNENTYVSKKDNLGNFLFNAIVLCGIVVGVMLVAGVAFGGFRILTKRFLPDSVFDRKEAVEIISLHLEEGSETVSGER